eukprot:1160217-Pelagomonas_calceolata.AAC.17
MGFQAGGRQFSCACMTHSRQQQQRGSRVGPIQQGLAGAGCQAACPDGPGTTLRAPPFPKSSLTRDGEMEQDGG